MNFNLHDLVLLAPEDFLLGVTCVILFIDLFLKQSQRAVTHWLAIAALLGALAIVLCTAGPAETAFNGAYIHDTVAAVLKVFILGIVAVVFVFARRYLEDRKLFIGEFYTLMLFSTLGMMLLVSATSAWCIWAWNCSRCRATHWSPSTATRASRPRRR